MKDLHGDNVELLLGRTRLEPIAIVVLSVIMCSASVQVISESLQTTVEDIRMLRRYPSNASEYVHPITMTVVPISIMISTIGNHITRRGNDSFSYESFSRHV